MKQTVTFASDGPVGHVVTNGHVVTVQTVFRIVSAVTIPKNHMWYRMGYIVMFIIVSVQTVFRIIVSAVTIPKKYMWYRMGYIVMFIIV